MKTREKNGLRESLPENMQKTYDVQIDAIKGSISRATNSRGRNMLQMHVDGLRLAISEMVLAKCADCMALYADGKIDCQVFSCPLYMRMPYRAGKKRCVRPERRENEQEAV